MFPIRPITEGMQYAPGTPEQQRRAALTYDAARASREACDAAFRRGASIAEAQQASSEAYRRVMEGR